MEDGRNTSGKDESASPSSPELDIKHTEKKGHGLRTPTGHSRSLSGSLSFLFTRDRSSEHSNDAANNEASPAIAAASTAMAMAVSQRSIRKRKGSLRKTALLGGGKLRSEDKELRNPQPEITTTVENHNGAQKAPETPSTPTNSFDLPTPRPISSVPPPVPMVTHPVHGDPSKISAQVNRVPPETELKRPVTADSTASTTSEDDLSISSPSIEILPLPSKPSDSYFPPQPRPLQVRSTTPSSRSSPLASLPPTVPSPTPSEWDYSETRWWGWLILVVTWVVFVVGMGSCFGVWSWAWDVGSTPKAPPELEDDPTLPIVGYYPALIILTTVMAWVWVTIAWVGMKYFKHATMTGDEELS
ncbi:hypothetical protein ACLMJK_000732 [Lecanora helva]